MPYESLYEDEQYTTEGHRHPVGRVASEITGRRDHALSGHVLRELVLALVEVREEEQLVDVLDKAQTAKMSAPQQVLLGIF